MVMSGRSVHLTTCFSYARLTKQLTSTLCTYFSLVTDNNSFLDQQKGGNCHRNSFMIKSPLNHETGPGSNSQPQDLRSGMLTTALHGPVLSTMAYVFFYISSTNSKT